MKESILSLLLILLIEGICAIVAYLKARLMRHVNRGQSFDSGYDFGSDAQFA